MENFNYNGNFYAELYDLAEDLEYWKEDLLLEEYPVDFTLKIDLMELRPIVEFTPESIAEGCILDDRYSEENAEDEYAKIIKALTENIDFEKLNSLIPKLYYATGKTQLITKQDLIDAKNN